MPVDVTLALLRAAMKASPVKRFLVDGFPRAVDQAIAFEAGVAAPNLVLFFDCPLVRDPATDPADLYEVRQAASRGRVPTSWQRFNTHLVGHGASCLLGHALRLKTLSLNSQRKSNRLRRTRKCNLEGEATFILLV